MDGQEHALKDMTDCTRRLKERLLELMHMPNGPHLDIEWLLLRCSDMDQFKGNLRKESWSQLQEDVVQFDQEFPGLLPLELVNEFANVSNP